MRAISTSVLAFGIACGALLAPGCGQGANGQTTEANNTSGSDALSAVQNCQQQAHGCLADGGGATCEQELRSCLTSVLPDGGGPASTHTPRPDDGGGPPTTPPGLDDGGNPKAHADVDDGGGSRPALPDAAVAALTKPVGGDSGAPVLPCIDALRACLATATSAESCADQARTCLEAHQGGRSDAAGPH